MSLNSNMQNAQVIVTEGNTTKLSYTVGTQSTLQDTKSTLSQKIDLKVLTTADDHVVQFGDIKLARLVMIESDQILAFNVTYADTETGDYNIGTCDITKSSATVSGTGTTWVGNIAIGDVFTIRDSTSGHNASYTVKSITSNTELVLDQVPFGLATETGLTYVAATPVISIAGQSKFFMMSGSIITAITLDNVSLTDAEVVAIIVGI